MSLAVVPVPDALPPRAIAPRAVLVCTLACAAAAAMPAAVTGQDLFELEVFDYGGVQSGEYEVEVHANALSRGTVDAASVTENHRPTHLSVEISRGWTNRLETALFVQTAPFGPAGSARFAGGHVRAKLRLDRVPATPVRLAVSAEYAFNRAAFDHELQTLELRAITDFERGRLSLVVNPMLEVVTRGSDEGGLEPVFDVSAKAAWQLLDRLAVIADYFSAAATTRHLRQEPDAHHLLFGGVVADVGRGWEIGISAGHCVTSSEPWLMKSIVGYRF